MVQEAGRLALPPPFGAVVGKGSEVLDQRYQPPLSVTVAVDVPLRGLDRAMPSEQLNIAQRTTGFVHKPSRSRDECSAT